jgi:cytochrome c oxidase subunit 3
MLKHTIKANTLGDYHLVEPSPWPILMSLSLFILAIGAVLFMHHHQIGTAILPLGFVCVITIMYKWWKDVLKEGIKDKAHSVVVRDGLKIGMVLFIASEVMFFAAFFWGYFHASLDPAGILDGVWVKDEGIWPPKAIKTFNPWGLPFTNTLILLLSGTTVTWAHYSLLNHNQKDLVRALAITVLLGLSFSILQFHEYSHAPFNFKDGIYASNFYMATGFHGAHVIIGTIFLAVCLLRAKKGHFQQGDGHLGFEFAAWYWHFVDVVWLFLFCFIYLRH